jgi:FdrA protein
LAIQGKLHRAQSLSHAAWLAYCLSTGEPVASTRPFEAIQEDEDEWARELTPEQQYCYGLFTGGTLAAEALVILRRTGPVYSNLSPPEPGPLGHTVLDLGDDVFTRGKPHPMIDPTPRCEMMVEVGSNPETAILLLDLVLGHGAHPDPAGLTAEAVSKARKKNPRLVVAASITGTDRDPQGLATQETVLKQAGVLVLPSNSAAAGFAARLVNAIQEAR